MIDLKKTRVIVTAWPDNKWPVELILFVEQLGIEGDIARLDDEWRVSFKKRDRTCARNTAIRDLALGSPPKYQYFIFVDSDVRPGELTRSFLDLDADVKACQVPMRAAHAWCWPTSFHEALWCTSREVLEAVKPPYFMQQYNSEGTELEGCICKSFRDKVLAAGFSIAHGGWAEHDGEGKWC